DCSNSTDHSPQVRTSSDSRFGQATRRRNKASPIDTPHIFLL
ncbi:hypothetical protein AVEN_53647-1, partial [Araneus ventricosus]